MLKNIMQKIVQRHNLGKPRVVVGVPSGITEVEERAVEESVLQAGAKEVYLIAVSYTHLHYMAIFVFL